MKQAAFYARVSTDKQDGSLETQDATAVRYATGKDIQIPDHLKFVDPYISREVTLFQRPDGKRMVNTLKLYPEVRDIITTKCDRMFGSISDTDISLHWFKEQGITVHFVDFGGDSLTTSGFVGELILRILGAVAQFEREMIRNRIQVRLDHKRSKRELTGTVPYGWDAVPTGQLTGKGATLKRLVDNAIEQQWIRLMADWRAGGWSYKAIADELNRRGVPSKTPAGQPIYRKRNGQRDIVGHTSGRWQSGNVKGVLENRYVRDLLSGVDSEEQAA